MLTVVASFFVAGPALAADATSSPTTAATTATTAATTTAAGPASTLAATQMKVSVWPEYDDPKVLVINEADLDPSVKLPTEVSFNIPKDAEIGMACEIDAGGNHACKPYEIVDKGDYQTLTYKVEAQHKVFMEYYYEAFPAVAAGQRDFTFTFRPSFNVQSLQLEVQEPLRTTGFVTTPNLPTVQTDGEGFKLHTEDLTNVTPEKPMDVKISYSKSDAKTSVKLRDKTGAGSAAPSGPTASSGGGNSKTLIIVLAAIAIVAVFFGGYQMLRPAPVTGRGSGRGGRRPANDTRGRKNPEPPAASLARQGGAHGGRNTTKFCTACGSSIRRQDGFCPECGEEQS